MPWAMLGMNIIFGSPILPDLMGIIVGHLYHFLTVLHPRNGGRNYLKTPLWVYPWISFFLFCFSLILFFFCFLLQRMHCLRFTSLTSSNLSRVKNDVSGPFLLPPGLGLNLIERKVGEETMIVSNASGKCFMSKKQIFRKMFYV